jgi:hypothetical protein
MKNSLPTFSKEKYILEHSVNLQDLPATRREFLLKSGMGFGALSIAPLFGLNPYDAEASGIINPLAPKEPHFPAKAKAVIHLFASGAPSHVDTWDPKPLLNKYDNTALPGLEGLAFGSPFKFEKKGNAGIEVSEVFPHLGECVDDMAIVRSLWTDIPAHEVASRFMHTGSLQLPKPSMGSWVVYGLGTTNQNMPGFITIGGQPEWRQSAFLPGMYQGCNVNYNSRMDLEDVIMNIKNQFTPLDRQRRELDYVKKLNEIHSSQLQKDAQFEARIQSFEMAFKMQTEATDAFDITKESKETRDMYGNSETANKLLVARRLVETGVRFVQIDVGGWDHHSNLDTALRNKATEIDGPAAALIKDLKQRGLFDSTLIIWGGEFGRTVTRDRNGNASSGRDHNGRAMVSWLAGGGVKGGIAYGSTDEFGARAVENKVHIHDLHATFLKLLGFDHTRLTYRYNGRDFRFTDNFGNIVKDIIA